MANQVHLDMLKQGVQVWNQWREAHQDIQPNLRGADLREVVLRGANLFRADLSSADLSSADLRKINLNDANLSRANLNGVNLNEVPLSQADLRFTKLNRAKLRSVGLYEANLRQAQLNNADLSFADFDFADLSDANLSSARLLRTNLSGANLNGTNLSQAHLLFTLLGGVDLHLAKGLDTIKHDGPSIIGIDTILRSQGNIPEVFFKGAGVPDSFISYARSLIGRPLDYYTCFISYSSQDEVFAKRLYADLQNKGVRCWFAPEDLKIGAKLRPNIDESIRLYDKLLLVLSEYSVSSQWVEQEVETALEKERKENRTVLFPIRLDRTVMDIEGGWPALIRNTRNIGDFTRWKRHDAYQKALDRLLRDLKAEA